MTRTRSHAQSSAPIPLESQQVELQEHYQLETRQVVESEQLEAHTPHQKAQVNFPGSADRSVTMAEVLAGAPSILRTPSTPPPFASPLSPLSPSQTLSPEHASMLAQSFRLLLSMAADKSDAWAGARGSAISNDANVVIMARTQPETYCCIKAYGTVAASRARIVRAVTELTGNRAAWDTLWRGGSVLQQHTDGASDLRQMLYQLTTTTTASLLCLHSSRTLRDGSSLVVAVAPSIGADNAHPLLATGDYTPVAVEMIGWIVQPVTNAVDQCVCTYVSSVNVSALSDAARAAWSAKQSALVSSLKKALSVTK